MAFNNMSSGEYVQALLPGNRPVSGSSRRAQPEPLLPQDATDQQSKVVLLFDLNGVLLYQVKENQGAGKKLKRTFHPRRGVEHLVRLLPHFHLGIFSSATGQTVHAAINSIEQAIRSAHTAAKKRTGIDLGPLPQRVFPKQLILDRLKARVDKEFAKRPDGKDWDTLKPLAENGFGLSSTLLIDDTPRKAMRGEESNMIVVPPYEGSGEESKPVLELLVDHLVAFASNARDVRLISQTLQQSFDAAVLNAAHLPPTSAQMGQPAQLELSQGMGWNPAMHLMNPPVPMLSVGGMGMGPMAGGAGMAPGVGVNLGMGVGPSASGMPGTVGRERANGKERMDSRVAKQPVKGGAKGVAGAATASAVGHEEDFKAFWNQSEMHTLLLDYRKATGDAALPPLNIEQVQHLEPDMERHVFVVIRAAMLVLLTVPKGVPAHELCDFIMVEPHNNPFAAHLKTAKKKMPIIRRVLDDLVLAGGIVEVPMAWLWSTLVPCFATIPGFKSRNPLEAYMLKALDLLQELQGVAVSQLTNFLQGFHPLLAGFYPRQYCPALQKSMVMNGDAGYFKVPDAWEKLLKLSRKKVKTFMVLTEELIDLEALQESIEVLVSLHEKVVGKAPLQLNKRQKTAHLAQPMEYVGADGAPVVRAGASISGGAVVLGTDTAMAGVADGPEGSWQMGEGEDGGDGVDMMDSSMMPMQPGTSAERLCPDELQEASCLHSEVVRFATACLPEEDHLADVMAALNIVEVNARIMWPQARAVAFGSQATGLALPGSDLDVVLLDVAGHELLTPAEGFSKEQKQDIAANLQRLMESLRSAGVLKRGSLIHRARVPIIKCVLNVGHGIAADISLGTRNGAQAVLYVQQLLREAPPLRPLCLLIKAFLKEKGLNEVYNGGLSSWSLVNMAVAHLQCEGFDVQAGVPDPDSNVPSFPVQELRALRQQDLDSVDLAWLLWAFFERYGNRFDYFNDAISIMHGGVRRKPQEWITGSIAKHGKKRGKAMLCVEDPQQSERDIAGGSYEIRNIVTAFRAASAAMWPLVNTSESAVARPPVASWATIQADGTHQTVQVGTPFHEWRLNCVLDIRHALERSAEMHKMRLNNHTPRKQTKGEKKKKAKGNTTPNPANNQVANRGGAGARGLKVQGGVQKQSGYPQPGGGQPGVAAAKKKKNKSKAKQQQHQPQLGGGGAQFGAPYRAWVG